MTTPSSVFISLMKSTQDSRIEVGVLYHYIFRSIEKLHIGTPHQNEYPTQDDIYNWMLHFLRERKMKIVAVSFDESVIDPNDMNQMKLCERLWLDFDIIPITKMKVNSKDVMEHVRFMTMNYFELPSSAGKLTVRESSAGDVPFYGFDIPCIRFDEHRRVFPQFLTTLDTYQDQMYAGGSVSQEMFQRMSHEAERFKKLGNRMLFLNSTAQGGGVALMRHALLRVYDLLGCDVNWHVLTASHKIFNITKKKFHNMLQGIATPDIVLNKLDVKILQEWSEKNAIMLKQPIKQAKVIVIDDYQPSGLIPFIKLWNPHAKIIYRSHIHIDSALVRIPDSAQAVTWDYIWESNQVKHVDLFLSHPIPEFVPDMVPSSKIILMPAATDPLDGLNKPLHQKLLNYYIILFNNFLIENCQQPLDINRPYIIQTARFDPSKGYTDVLEGYRRFRKKLPADYPEEKIPQLVIVGHGSIDDPEGIPMINAIESMLQMDTYEGIRNDVKRGRLPHNDQILNALLRMSHVALQLSHREGLEVKVSECLLKGKPMIIYDAGGMKLQVKDKSNAFIVKVGSTRAVTDLLLQMFRDTEMYDTMSKNAANEVQPQFFTVSNCLNWMFMANELVEKGTLNTDMNHIQDLLARQTTHA
jgi:glycosyltransferase involved in cell wall biosynthesis